MTVGELREKLATMDSALPVLAQADHDDELIQYELDVINLITGPNACVVIALWERETTEVDADD